MFLHTGCTPTSITRLDIPVHWDGWRYLDGEHGLMTDRLNEFIDLDDHAYFFTKPVWENRKESYGGASTQFTGVREQAKVISKKKHAILEKAIEPVPKLLRHSDAASVAALENLLHSKFGDCVTNCNSSYESVMKVICGRKGFGYA